MILAFILSACALLVGYYTGWRDAWLRYRRFAFRWRVASLIYRIGYKKLLQIINYEKLSEKKYFFFVSKKGYYYLNKPAQENVDGRGAKNTEQEISD